MSARAPIDPNRTWSIYKMSVKIYKIMFQNINYTTMIINKLDLKVDWYGNPKMSIPLDFHLNRCYLNYKKLSN